MKIKTENGFLLAIYFLKISQILVGYQNIFKKKERINLPLQQPGEKDYLSMFEAIKKIKLIEKLNTFTVCLFEKYTVVQLET